MVTDFTYVSGWRGWVGAAIAIDVLARKIVGWGASTSMTIGCVVDALTQTICQLTPGEADTLIHRGDRHGQYLSI